MMNRLEEIRRRWASVWSPTPWRLDEETGTQVLAADGSTVATHSIDGYWAGGGPELSPDDARAIAMAPDDVAFLLTEVERLSRERAEP